MTITNTSYEIYEETETERKLREYATLPDPKRPEQERYLEIVYTQIANNKIPKLSKIPHSDLFYIRAALENQFSDRKFTMDEIRTLLDQEFSSYNSDRPENKNKE